MPNKLSPHDKLFKITMSRLEVAKGFLTRYLPSEIAAKANFTTLELCSGSFTDPTFKGYETDLLYSVKFGDVNGYILLEHLSTPDKSMPLRLLNYTVKIMNRHWIKTNRSTIPIVVQLVIYTGHKKYPYSMDLYDLYGEEKELAKIISAQIKSTQLISLWDIPVSELQPTELFAPMAAAFKCKGIEKNTLVKFLGPYLKQIDQVQDFEYIAVIVNYLLATNDFDDPNKFCQEISAYLSLGTGEKIMNMAERLRQDGWQKGRQEGILQGMQQGVQQGEQHALEQVALNLLHMGRPISEVAKATNLPTEKIKHLSKDSRHT